MNNYNLDLIFKEDGLIKRIKSDYIPRPSQIEAANIIYNALQYNDHSIVEGPCGFGKTFAYLIPVLEYMYNTPAETKAVVVTNGISLQEQLVEKDLPAVQRIFRGLYSEEKKFALLKGKANFLCMKKMVEFEASVARDEQVKKIIAWYEKTETGNFSELDFVPDNEIAKQISCTEEGQCLGKGCRCYASCFYQKHKQLAFAADIVVTNYHVLFSDIQTGGMLLPLYQILIFDEAHEAAEIYRNFKEVKFSVSTVKNIKNTVKELRNKYGLASSVLSSGSKYHIMSVDPDEESIDKSDSYYYVTLFNDLIKLSEDYLKRIAEVFFKEGPWAESKVIDVYMRLPDSTAVKKCIDELINIFKGAVNLIQEIIDQSEKNSPSTLACLNGYTRVVDRLKNIICLLDDCEDGGDDNTVYWVDRANKDESFNNTLSSRISICSKPVKVGPLLNEVFFSRPDLKTILTSATLSVGESFNYIKAETGLDLFEQKQNELHDDNVICGRKRTVNEFIGVSPFNLTEQQLWYLPENFLDGDDSNFDAKLPEMMEEIIVRCHGGALCLFTSVKNLNNAHSALKSKLRNYGINVLKQGEAPKIKLLEAFKEDADSVLFATKSFFTGVDIPGNSLRCVIIDKFPFTPPTDPVMQKLQKLEKDAFSKYTIPMMVIALKQAVGRGVRSVSDKCVIAILDGRIKTARYKTRVASSFNYEKTGTRIPAKISEFLGFLEDGELF